MDCFRSRLAETELRVGEAEDTLQSHGVSLHTLQTKMKTLEVRAEDAENRNRRNNLRIVGLPKGMEGMDLTSFTEHLLCALLPGACFSYFFVVYRAHRMPANQGASLSCYMYFYFEAPDFQGPRSGPERGTED